MTAVHLSDEQMWADALAGSQSAFGALFDRYANAVYNHCFRLSASWSMAEDATQVTFLTAWRKRERIRLVNGSILPWLLSVAANAVRDERRSARRWLSALLRTAPDRDAGTDIAEHVSARVDDEQRMRTVLRAVRHLPRAERDALVLCVWSSVSYPDAAALLGIAESSVRARVSRARARLTRLLASADDDRAAAQRDAKES